MPEFGSSRIETEENGQAIAAPAALPPVPTGAGLALGLIIAGRTESAASVYDPKQTSQRFRMPLTETGANRFWRRRFTEPFQSFTNI